MRTMTYRENGVTLVEVLISMVILAVGLMSLVVLHGRLHLLQVEAYQRSQALVLVEDLASRMYLNRDDVASYVTAAGPIGGTLANCPTTTATRAEADLTEWCETLVGGSESLGGTDVGAMVGGRACVQDLGGNQYLLTVAWQGAAPVSAPPASVTCAANLYNSPGGTPCANDQCRRVITTVVRLANLT